MIVEKMSKEIARQRAKQYLSEGLFPPRCMSPKIEAAVEFVEHGGERAVVCMPARVCR